MANVLGERVWIKDGEKDGHWEYRNSSDRVRLDQEAKVRNYKIKRSIKEANQKKRQQQATETATLTQQYKAGQIAAADANAKLDEIKKKYR